jgi:hypothetical protein
MGEDRDITHLNTDELIAQMQLDELSEAPLISPVNYSKIRPITPQLVYYAIRNKKIKTYVCNCGRRCIDIKEADDFYRAKRGPEAWPFGKERDKVSEQDAPGGVNDIDEQAQP